MFGIAIVVQSLGAANEAVCHLPIMRKCPLLAPHLTDKGMTSAVNNGEKHLVDFIRQPDGKSLGILGQVT